MIDWTPRSYQRELLLAMRIAKYKRACLCWHRRCLAKGTYILMWDGTKKCIEDVRAGDIVVGLKRGKCVPSKVLDAWFAGEKRVFKTDYISPKIFSKEQVLWSFYCTIDHKIAVKRHGTIGYIDAGNLGRRDDVVGAFKVRSGYEVELRTLNCHAYPTEGCYANTYDLETETENFIVSNGIPADTYGIVVHNSGKDFTCWMYIIEEAIRTPGIYYYVLPSYRQGKKAIWDAIGNDGRRFLDYIPKDCIDGNPNQTEMKIRFKSGSILQVIGGDDPDTLRGTNPRGVIISEFSRMNPTIWDVILRPILAANHGWAILNSTPNGRNHFKDLFDMATAHPEAWYASRLTVEDTHVVLPEVIEQDRREGMSEDMVLQEYYVSFNAGADGAYYAKLMESARNEGRIGRVAYDRSSKVYTAWDLGFGDSTAIIFFQLIGREVRVIDHYEASGEGLDHYAKVLQDRGYVYATHYAPHDVEHGSLQTGVSLKEVAKGLGIDFTTLGRHSFAYGIEQARITLPFCFFDEMKCKRLVKCLDNYRKKYNKAMELYLDEPLHDDTSHSSDAFRYLAIARAELTQSRVIDPNELNRNRYKAIYGVQNDLPAPFQQPMFHG